MEAFKILFLITLFKYVGSMQDWSRYMLSTVVLVSAIHHSSAFDNDDFATLAPEATSHKRTTELPVIGTTKNHQVDELDTEIVVASGDYTRASQFYTPIRPSVPVQISASDSRQIERDIRPSRSSNGVVEQQTTVMSQGFAYTGANQESLLKTVPHLNISTPLYQTSRSIQPSVLVPSLERPIKPTPSFGYAHSSSLTTTAPAAHKERLESFTLSILRTTSEVSPTASLRQFQTAQKWRTSQALQSHLLLLPTVDLSTPIWSDTKLNTPQIMMASTGVQPSPSDSAFPSGTLMQTTDSRSLSQLSHKASSDLAASGILDATAMPTHAQISQETVTPSLKSLPDWLKLSTPDLPQESTEYYQTQTVNDMAPSETGQTSDDDQALRPAMTPSPSIIMESATSYWNWSHRIPINSNNSTVSKEGLSTPNKLLVVSVMVVLGCFALVALALRIGNRIIKLRKKGNKKTCGGYLRSLCPKMNTQPRPKPMKVTVRMTRQTSKKSSVKSISSRQSSVKTIASTASGQSTSSILRHSKSLANLHNPSELPSAVAEPYTSNPPVKRSRTMDALLEIGAFSPDFPEAFGPENLLESSSEATLLCRDSKNKRTRFSDEAYDNPLMKISMDESTGETSASYGSQTELQLFMDRQDSKDNLSSDCRSSPDRTSNDSPICFITPLKTGFDSPQQSPVNSEKSIENSETESQSDATRKLQFNKCLKWRALQQRCSSKDSGYGDTTSPCQDVDVLALQEFKLADETSTENDNLMGIRDPIPKRRSSFDSPANSSPSSCYPLSSIEESPPPKSRCQRCDSLYLNSDDSLNSQERLPQQSRTWTQNISGLLRDTLSNYLYSNDRRYDDVCNANALQYNTDVSYQYPECTYDTAQYDINCKDEPPSPSLFKKFFKKRTSTISTQTSGPPLSKRPSVKWDCEDGTYMMKPREDAGIEFMGPIYLAKSVEDFGPFVSGSVMDRDMGNSAV